MTGHAELIAFYELTQAKAKYCRTLDTQDWNALAALMVDDIEFGMSDGQSDPQMTVGRNETLALLKSLVAGAKTAHQVHTPEVDLDDDEARVIWAVQDRIVFDNGTSVTGYGHYTERWVRHADAWKLASLLLTHLITDVH
ncbi:nuclear transport factor 2 family protein [Mycobacterium stomatepiae]|uniref:Bile-acid 7-alpha-dehydratase n=1 Tax=Mycobacterium stomatepiae TaxID=470076 RepID=A0A7I7Q678_9MYCO|nr:nuclear transport factor 2 family protein [Mycobacterium stomatepiae]MCV7162916.1 nuclear transport factor 2 family protein [Mycobacterium stomatepiae]BBY21864.1 bile-acid 7-alpha-dehydratase [Mycobacterium stomatepiae]